MDRLRFDVFDFGDVEEMVLVVVDQKSFHLRRVHPAIGLRNIENRDAEVRKYVAGIRSIARRLVRIVAITSTKIVIGRRRAKETMFI